MEWASDFVARYGYLAVFLWTFIEGESVFIAAAALAATGLLTPWKVIVTAALGAYAGHLLFFAVGRWRGVELIRSVPLFARHYDKINLILDRYAHWSIFLFQYLYGTRMAAAILFGCSSIGFARFAAWQALNCISWSVIIYTIGHLLGLAAIELLHRFGLIGVALFAALGGAVIVFGGRRIRRRIFRWWDGL